MGFYYNLYFILPEVFILLSSCTLLIFGVFFSSSNKFGFPIIFTNFAYLFLQILFFSILLLPSKPIFSFLWNNLISIDSFSYFSKIILFTSTFFWTFLSLNVTSKKKINIFEYWILILLNLVALCFLLQSCDLLSIYVSIEFQSLIFYILASLNRTSEFSTESGLKYFILGAFSSAFLLFGISVLYNLTGLTNLYDLSKLLFGTNFNDSVFVSTLILSLFFIITSLLFKLNAAPFHFWTPDVYDGVLSIIMTYFALIPKIAIFGILTKILVFAFFAFSTFWREFLILSCFLSSIIGVLGAFYQVKWKRFVAYSSISHISFVLLSLIIGDLESLSFGFFYLIIYLIMSLIFFTTILNLISFKFPTFYQLRFTNSINSLGNLNSILAFSLLIVLFSMAGIPPLAGFFSKFFIFFAALKSGSLGLCILLVVFSCLASFYYIKFVRSMFFTSNTLLHPILLPMSKSNSILLGIYLYIILFLFFDIDLFLSLAKLLAQPLIKV